jgi:hypothetical protein
MKTFIKPDLDLYFNAMPLIGQWLKFDYNKANTIQDLTNLVNKWLDEAYNSELQGKKERAIWFHSGACYVYGFLTGKSLESKKLI